MCSTSWRTTSTATSTDLRAVPFDREGATHVAPLLSIRVELPGRPWTRSTWSTRAARRRSIGPRRGSGSWSASSNSEPRFAMVRYSLIGAAGTRDAEKTATHGGGHLRKCGVGTHWIEPTTKGSAVRRRSGLHLHQHFAGDWIREARAAAVVRGVEQANHRRPRQCGHLDARSRVCRPRRRCVPQHCALPGRDPTRGHLRPSPARAPASFVRLPRTLRRTPPPVHGCR